MINIKPVSISEEAATAIKEILEDKSIPGDYGLRVGVDQSAGCGEKNYILGFDKKSERDIAYEIDDIPVFIKKSDVLFLTGMRIDHIDNDDGKGFTVVKESVI